MKWKKEKHGSHPTWTLGSVGFTRPGAFVTDFREMKSVNPEHRFTACAWTRTHHMGTKGYATAAQAKAAANRWLRAHRVMAVPK